VASGAGVDGPWDEVTLPRSRPLLPLGYKTCGTRCSFGLHEVVGGMLPNVSARSRVVVAMSGGVDSSVAAARLCAEGHEVVGVTLHLWDYPPAGSARSRCCAPEDIHDARRVADKLGISHYAFDRRVLFEQQVVEPFVDAYLAGRTPSPCVWCNRTVKVPELLALADRLGATRVATGHYARVLADQNGAPRLHRGRDSGKDQSYFLYMLRPEQLARLLLPLGESTKDEVRAEAWARGLPGAGKGESQELCFVADGYVSFVEQRAAARVRPGPIEDTDGRTIGAHAGIHRFTVGQRKGLGVARGEPAFVVDIDADRAAVLVGSAEQARARGAVLVDCCWADDVAFPTEAMLKVRSQHGGVAAWLVLGDGPAGQGTVRARFAEPIHGVSPGQVAVAYRGDRVLGGATIAAALRAERGQP
jgi:tRNA-uridine 2-sulfurtransferase